MTTFDIPKTFYDDRSERGLPSPTVVKATKRHSGSASAILPRPSCSTTPCTTRRDTQSPHLMGLKASARSTVRAIETAMENTDD